MMEKESYPELGEKIREIQGWPNEGVNFKDITPALEDRETFIRIIDEMVKPYLDQEIDKIVAIDARGFILGAAMAYRLGCGVSLVRKEGKLPYETYKEDSISEYSHDILEMNIDTIKKGEKVVIVDDILATGGTAEAAAKLVEKEGGEIIGMSFMINLPFLHGSEKLNQYNLYWLKSYDSE